ncbi:MAG: hypothetical protein E7641_02035 [Ruminococcaceae bacterium]|nr:hypothetical protein [Oscillospiraceae bacterium]
MKRFFLLFMVFVLVLGSFAACTTDKPVTDPEATTTGATTTGATTATTTAATTAEPEDTRKHVYFDDRVTLEELIGKSADSFEIKNQTVTSKVSGTDTADSAVFKYDEANKIFTAVGTGTATIAVGGEEFEIVVDPAPISMFLIIGHSLGMGSQGNAPQSVKCEEGQAYHSEIGGIASASGISAEATKKPSGIDKLVDGTGYQGVDGAFAWRWNQLTGEKVWVVNAAIGGSCINEWIKGQTNNVNAIHAFKSAAKLLKKEIAAGHYEFKDMGVIYFSAANFDYKGVTPEDNKMALWYDSLWTSIQEGMTEDVNGDGTVDKPKSFGFVPLWQPDTTQHINKFNFDKPATFYMSASKGYEYAYTASIISRAWMTAGSSLSAIFPKIEYKTQSKEVKQPTKIADIVADTAHLTQTGYNAYGIDIAENTYSYLRTDNTTDKVTFFNAAGNAVSNINMSLASMQKISIVSSNTAAGNFDITVSDNLKYEFPGNLKAMSKGTGTITVSQNGTVLGTLTVTVS